MKDKHLLILYYSHTGHTQKMAEHIALGVDSSDAPVTSKLRTVKPIDGSLKPGQTAVTLDDLKSCQGLILGSPCYFGNMAAPLKHFLDSTTSLWLNNDLVDKPAAVFTSTGSLHGGHESTLLSMTIPLIHHGMVIVGIPYTQLELTETKTGGTPYGPSHLAGSNNQAPIDKTEKQLCIQLGKRMANLSHRLAT